MRRIAIDLTNDFHNTECTVLARVAPNGIDFILSRRQCRRARNQLCGSDECTCSSITGSRPEFWEETEDGGGRWFNPQLHGY